MDKNAQNHILGKVLKTAKALYGKSVEQSEKARAEELLERTLVGSRKINKP